ncbi:MAG: single-stranded-DNA-specific exonuclease RecJ [bacterium]|nr:single-stranded-DNA-specific exonuclease RecJ [bacterium]
MSPRRTPCDWRVAAEDREQTAALAKALDVPRPVAHLLTCRGVATPEEGQRFLQPGSDYFTDPFLLDDMDKAVDRIRVARDGGERITVFGDYDVDGVSGTAILVNALRRYGIESCSYGIPDRLSEGYGLSPERVRSAHDDGVNLIVTADNGSTAHASAAAARELGIDLIVTDHHQLEGGLPDALAVVNPKRQDSSYPSPDLCGAAVAFKLAQALTGEMADLDIVALGTVADIVPLRDENRDLVAAGLAYAKRHPRLGLERLASIARVDLTQLRAEHIAFQLGPRINAGGRLGDGITGLKLLLADDADEAGRLAGQLNEANEERRAIEKEIFEEARARLRDSYSPDQRTIVLAGSNWHPGVIGIVASRLQSLYYRPIVMIAIEGDGCGRGSARSIAGFDIISSISACQDHLVKFGGHAGAAGLTVETDKLDAFREAFEAEAARLLPDEELRRVLEIDAQIAFSEVDSQLIALMDRLQPFGHGNPAPLFCTYGATVVPHSWRELRGGHMRVTLKQGAHMFTAVGFHMGDRLAEVQSAASLDVAFTPQFNTFRGETTIQLVLKDLRPNG